ncbi:hypothetical protein AB0J86_12775 [Micromonospora sp. NPDC049559]|uniref:hypothetical protein n=1 Tax=Micromonospora sp. NPDC049559 TaxID=3155923 RepID=UPI003435E456
MRRIGTIGDRLLSFFVPKAVAGACCDQAFQCWQTSSGCGPGKVRQCCYDCNCRSSCGPCYVV